MVSEIESKDELKYGFVTFDMDEIELFLKICRKVIDKGRTTLSRLTKIEANLRDLRLKYVAKGQNNE